MSELDPAPEPEVIDKPIDEPAKDIPQDKAVDPPVVAKDAKPEPGAAKDAPKDEPKDGDKPDDFAWPDDWRERVADGDDDLAKELSRYGSMKNVVKALREAKATIRSGKLTKPMPDASDEKAMAEWRKEQGIPDDPSGYKLPDEVVKNLTDEDKPMLASFTADLHAEGASNAEVARAVKWYYKTTTQIAERRAEMDNEAREAAEDTLRKDWAHGEFKANMTLAARAIESIPGVGKGWAEFRDPHGTRLGDNPEFIAWAADMGRNQFGDVTFANGDSERKHTARKQEIEELMRTDINAYREKGWDKEYQQILDKEAKRGAR